MVNEGQTAGFTTLQSLMWPELGICSERELYLRTEGAAAASVSQRVATFSLFGVMSRSCIALLTVYIGATPQVFQMKFIRSFALPASAPSSDAGAFSGASVAHSAQEVTRAALAGPFRRVLQGSRYIYTNLRQEMRPNGRLPQQL